MLFCISNMYVCKKRKKLMYLSPVISPTAKFHLALLFIEGKPSDVDFARALKNAWRDVGTISVAFHHHVRWVRAIKLFVGTAKREKKNGDRVTYDHNLYTFYL